MIGPFLRKELTTSLRKARVFHNRWSAVAMAGIYLLGLRLWWDAQGWDRASLGGALGLGRAMFGVMFLAMATDLSGLARRLAASIASGRDAKTLEVLLASRFTSLEIVRGVASAGLFEWANQAAAVLPVVVLLASLGLAPASWAIVTPFALGSTALLVAAVAVAASVGSKTAARAKTASIAWLAAWLFVPLAWQILCLTTWPAAPSWLTSALLPLLDSSPAGLAHAVLGPVPRAGGPFGALGRMIGWQSLATLALFAWSVARLRPLARSMNDGIADRGKAGRIRAGLRRAARRPPCGDDPVAWMEIHVVRRPDPVRRWVAWTLGLTLLAVLAVTTWWLAGPAFVELAARGYRSSSEAFTMPTQRPFVRLIDARLLGNAGAVVAPGHARLEFNILLRLETAAFALVWMMIILGESAETIEQERRRDTWLGLLATPLTAREILRGKALGVLAKGRWAASALVVVWVVGLACGAVHPLGFVGVLAFLVALGPYAANFGLSSMLWVNPNETIRLAESPRSVVVRRWGCLIGLFLRVSLMMAGLTLAVVGPIALAWAAPLTYEDVAAAIGGGPFPEFAGWPIEQWVGARGVLLGWVAGFIAMAAQARRVGRKTERRFDAAVGRPTRPS